MFNIAIWSDDRVADGARLESVCTLKGTVGSNPSYSAPNFFNKKSYLAYKDLHSLLKNKFCLSYCFNLYKNISQSVISNKINKH